MHAITLAAGKSTRLYPITASLPKCLLPVGEKTILDHQLEALLAANIQKIFIVVGFEKEKIYAHLKEKRYPIAVEYIENKSYETTGPILGGLRAVYKHLEAPLLFFHCDVLFDESMVQTLVNDPHDTVLPFRKGVWDEEAGKIIVDEKTGLVKEMGKHIEKERATGEYLQIAKFGASFLERLKTVITEREKFDHDGYTIDAFNDVVRSTSIEAFGLPFDGFAAEIDTPEDYVIAQELWNPN